MDTIPSPEFVDVSDRICRAIADYLPRKEGKVRVGFTRQGSINPEIAREQIYDAMKKAKKASGKRHLDPLMKRGFPEKMVGYSVSDLLGNKTVKKGSKGRWYIVKNYFASKLGWRRRKVVRVMELPKAHPRRKRKRKI